MAVTPAPRDLTPTQAAARIGESVTSLYRRLHAGAAPPNYKAGKFRRFPEDELERWLAKRQQAAK